MAEDIQFTSDSSDARAYLGKYRSIVDEGLEHLTRDKIIERIWDIDHSVWKPDPEEISNRLGWLHSPTKMIGDVPEIHEFVESVRSAGFARTVLLGMGGSSLAPEVFRHTFGVREGFPDLAVLDSTDPGAVLHLAREIDPARTLFVVSTKSGGTVETISFMSYFYDLVRKEQGLEKKTGQHFIAITDPQSGLEKVARDLKFRRIFLNDPDIGGRYSALSYFGLVPAALIGVRIEAILQNATRMANQCKSEQSGKNPGAWLGTIMGRLAKEGIDKFTLLISPPLSAFGAWAEQMVAESTGKEGKGILPVDGEDLKEPGTYSRDRYFVNLRFRGDTNYDDGVNALIKAGFPVIIVDVKDLDSIGAEFFRWEMATSIASWFMGINPFDQPNVESSKRLARDMVAAYQEKGRLPDPTPNLEQDGIKVYGDFSASTIEEVFKKFLATAKSESAGHYVAIQAFLMPTQEISAKLQDLRSKIQTRYGVATTVGYGPRFLHSTGQLHKGDAGQGFFIQLVGETAEDAAIPDQKTGAATLTFGNLKNAQALGDRQALIEAGRKLITFNLGTNLRAGLIRLSNALN